LRPIGRVSEDVFSYIYTALLMRLALVMGDMMLIQLAGSEAVTGRSRDGGGGESWAGYARARVVFNHYLDINTEPVSTGFRIYWSKRMVRLPREKESKHLKKC
jgi:hypothetical protein